MPRPACAAAVSARHGRNKARRTGKTSSSLQTTSTESAGSRRGGTCGDVERSRAPRRGGSRRRRGPGRASFARGWIAATPRPGTRIVRGWGDAAATARIFDGSLDSQTPLLAGTAFRNATARSAGAAASATTYAVVDAPKRPRYLRASTSYSRGQAGRGGAAATTRIFRGGGNASFQRRGVRRGFGTRRRRRRRHRRRRRRRRPRPSPPPPARRRRRRPERRRGPAGAIGETKSVEDPFLQRPTASIVVLKRHGQCSRRRSVSDLGRRDDAAEAAFLEQRR